jgi:hypothetical protein
MAFKKFIMQITNPYLHPKLLLNAGIDPIAWLEFDCFTPDTQNPLRHPPPPRRRMRRTTALHGIL